MFHRPAPRAVLGAFASAVMACLALTAAPAFAQSNSDLGPAIGAASPHDLSAPDQVGQVKTLSELSGHKGSVVVFVRSADWCPFCQRQLIELSQNFDEFVARGYSVISVSLDTQEDLATFHDRRDIAFTMLADPDGEIINAFGVRDPAYAQGHRAFGVPYPIGFVFDAEGVVVDKFYHAPGYGERDGFRTRVSAADVLASLNGAAGDDAGA